MDGLLLLVDFEKAFDSIEWKFLQKALNSFNFGPSICKWFETFWSGIELRSREKSIPSSLKLDTDQFNLKSGQRI
jgi:hypothetical protein